MSISRGDSENVVIFQYFKAQNDEVLNVLRGLPKMMEVELKIDGAAGGTWDPVLIVYKEKDAIYSEEVVDNMVANMPGYTPLPPPSMNIEGDTERILSPKHQQEFDQCMNDGNEIVMVASKTPIPIHRNTPGAVVSLPNTMTLAKTLPAEIQRDDESIMSSLTENTFGKQAADNESLSTLGLVNTTGTIHAGQGSTPSKVKYLRSKQKLQQEFKVIHLENQQEQLKLKEQVAALQTQLAQQTLPGPSTAPAGPIDHG